MSIAVPPELAGWTAAGVRHAVLLRVLPALRHDLATPISVVRMTALMLQRKLAADPVDTAFCAERAAALDQQAESLTQALRSLLGWGVGPGDAEVTRSALVASCVALLRPLFAMRGVAVEVSPGLSDATPDLPQPDAARFGRASSLRYLLLAALCYLHDSRPALSHIQIDADRDDALLLHPSNGAPGSGAPAMDLAASGETLPIDAAALECLAANLGHAIRLDGEAVWLTLSNS